MLNVFSDFIVVNVNNKKNASQKTVEIGSFVKALHGKPEKDRFILLSISKKASHFVVSQRDCAVWNHNV